MLSEKEINRLNGFLENKTFTYNRGIYHYDLPGEVDFDFKFKILGYKKMISVGEYYDYIRISVKLMNFRDDLSRIIFLRRGLKGDFLNKFFKENMYYFKHTLTEEIISILSMFDNDIRVSIETIEIEGNNKESLQEQKMTRQPIREVVKDIVNIIKSNEEGDFYLPDNDEGTGYSFGRLPFEFTVELDISHDNTLEGYLINAEYSASDEVIEMKIIYNPSDLVKNMYNIVGELNEILAHELEHGLQNYRGEMEKTKKSPTDPLKYYTQPHEISAQIAGFKRLSRIRKQPIEKVIRDWFESHQDIHQLNDRNKNTVIKKLLSYIR